MQSLHTWSNQLSIAAPSKYYTSTDHPGEYDSIKSIIIGLIGERRCVGKA